MVLKYCLMLDNRFIDLIIIFYDRLDIIMSKYYPVLVISNAIMLKSKVENFGTFDISLLTRFQFLNLGCLVVVVIAILVVVVVFDRPNSYSLLISITNRFFFMKHNTTSTDTF